MRAPKTLAGFGAETQCGVSAERKTLGSASLACIEALGAVLLWLVHPNPDKTSRAKNLPVAPNRMYLDGVADR